MSRFALSVFAVALLATPALSSARSAPPPPSATAMPVSVPSAAATMPPDKVQALALNVLGQMQNGRIDRSLFTDQVNGVLTDDMLRQMGPELSQLGQDPRVSLLSSQPVGTGITEYVFLLRSNSGNIDETIALDADGKIAEINFTADNAHF